LLADVQAAELFGALEGGPDNLDVGSVLLVYEVDRAQRVITVQSLRLARRLMVLHRVMCCYPDYARLLGAVVDTHALVFSYPARNLLSPAPSTASST
jgi:hypothetical protein